MRTTADKIKKLDFPKIQFRNNTEFQKPRINLEYSSIDAFIIKNLSKEILNKFPQYNIFSLALAPEMSEVILEIQEAFLQGVYPELNMGGTSESYVLKDCNGYPIAIFKPISSLWGSDAKKEIAAYRLDYDHFAKVPATVMATFSHPFFRGSQRSRLGSCQWFVDGIATLYVDRKKIPKIPAECIRRIAILDIRLINPDRHTSNMLYRYFENIIELIPIDHGAVLPDNLFGACFAWLTWEQSNTPFNKEELDYISLLDPAKDAKILSEELEIPMNAIENMVGATCLLKEAALRGWTVFQIGKAISREYIVKDGKRIWEPALLEKIMQGVHRETHMNWNEMIRSIQSKIEFFLQEVQDAKTYK